MTDDPAKAVMEAVATQGVVGIVRTRTAVEGEELVDRLLAGGGISVHARRMRHHPPIGRADPGPCLPRGRDGARCGVV
jgi:hypothetical protein